MTTELGANKGLYFGNSVKVASLPDPQAPTTQREMVVYGTLGGMVYVYDPEVPGGNGLAYELKQDLGWGVVGLDVGDVDGWLPGGDATNEIVVGTWMDDGTYDQFHSPSDPTKHRGHVIILDPDPATKTLVIRNAEDVITLNDTYSPGMFAAGVLGVKIDDVDHDGKKEIWCGDALGYLYCLARHTGAGFNNRYVAFYRSAGMGCYPAFYNRIFPIKTNDETTQVIVFTPGYVYRFSVTGVVPW